MTTPPSNEDTVAVPLSPGEFVLSTDAASKLESILNAYGQSLENPPTNPAVVPQPKIKKRLKVEPAEGSRLSMLLVQLPELEAAKKEAEERLREAKAAIQAEIAATVPDPTDLPDVFDIPADPYGGHPAYTLSAREGAWRLDTEAMKNQEPETYVKWATRGQPYWELRRVQKNRVKR